MRITTVAVTLAASLVFVAAAPFAHAEKSGTMVLSAEQIETTGADWEKSIKKTSTLTVLNDQWTMYFVAYLKKAAGSPQVNVVFYDEAEKKHEPTNAFPIATQASAKILVSSVSFGSEQGFKAGHSYKVMITRLVAGKEDVYARATVTLK
jgi:hypothetical protein